MGLKERVDPNNGTCDLPYYVISVEVRLFKNVAWCIEIGPIAELRTIFETARSKATIICFSRT